MIDVEDFCGKQFAMSGQYQLIELSEAKFLSIFHLPVDVDAKRVNVLRSLSSDTFLLLLEIFNK